MSSFFTSKKKNTKNAGQKLVVFLISFCLVFTFILPLKPARAQMDAASTAAQLAGNAQDTAKNVKDTWWQTFLKALQKAGSIAFQRTLSSALNKIAYDTATWIGSGKEGQKPLFVTEGWGSYLTKIGDEAAGQFIESFVTNLNNPPEKNCQTELKKCQLECYNKDTAADSGGNQGSTFDPKKCADDCEKNVSGCVVNSYNGGTTPSFNVCSPSSLEAKLSIVLGLVEQNRPQGPNCSASQMIKSWDTDINQKLKDFRRNDYLNTFVTLFDPASNDLGISVLARSDLSSKALVDTETAKTGLIAHKGWLDVRNIAGMTDAPPGSPERAIEMAQAVQEQNLGKITGDVFVDASSVFLNQLSLTAFNTLLRSLAKKDNNSPSRAAGPGPETDPGSGSGASSVKQATMKLLKPDFRVRTDYDILSTLAICPDSKKPGPDNCVIDDKFMQAITEQKTVAEALAEGYLHSDWQVTVESSGNSYNGSYALRNISILRKYRIVPVGWEEAARLLTSDPQNPRKATLGDLVSCFDKNDEYNSFSADFVPDYGWCESLVDPNWVLKAPLNYCKKEGVGAQILSTNIIPGNYEVSPNVPSVLNIFRSEGYCADNQTCIKEKNDGSCEAYGYCSEEKRTWNFGEDSCSPINNTCQSFSDSAGRKFSYLENTLNYGQCNPENSGCRRYSLSGNYASSTKTVSWSGNQNLYLNKNLSTCNNSDEGCTGLLRVKPTWGTNLVMNADFSGDNINESSVGAKLNNWPLIGGEAIIVDANEEPGGAGGKALKLSASGQAAGIYSDNDASLLPDNFQIIPGQSYTLSADIYIEEGLGVSLIIGEPTENFITTETERKTWLHVSVTRPANSSYNEPNFRVVGIEDVAVPDIVFYLKNLKFEMSGWDTGFSFYGVSKFYEKLLPPYLEQSCYVDATSGSKNYSLKPDAPAACSNYARRCNKDEVGCESFTAAKDGFVIGAKVTDSDYCPQECVGYDVYIAKDSYFNSALAENMIPSQVASCAAEAVGCNEFTNLDVLGQGGERKEYYTRLKQCIKPSSVSCSNFYAWEGTTGGYQLKSYNLKNDANNLPAVTADDSAICNAEIFNLPISDPDYNPDCREFYNATGQISYHLSSLTITCSDNCHAYRMSEKNIDQTLSAATCTGMSRHWDATSGTCISCLNGGSWDDTSGACVYQAIPGEGETCRASDNGCREYNGNNGSNVRLISYYDFEKGASGWSAIPATGVQVSAIANNNNEHSLQVASGAAAQLTVGNLVRQNSAYSLKFLARAEANDDLQIFFVDPATGARSDFSAVQVRGGNEWNLYQVNLAELNHIVGQPATGQTGELLVISGTGEFYFDDFILSEITDRYYLIHNSSQVPDSCYYDNFNQYQGGDYNLGCAQYTDRGQLKHNLRQFTRLCSNSSVGCEQMIDTKNYSPYDAGFWENGVATSTCDIASNPNCVKVDGDSAIYAVYDSSKSCGAAAQGCSRLGEGQGGANFSGWSDVFKNNNPDQYNNTLCGAENLGCEEWQSIDDNTSSYFKNPGTATCIYRVSNNAGALGKRWYKIPAKRCDLNSNGKIDFSEGTGKVCDNDNNCGSNKCLIDNNDYDCPVSYSKTIGSGGAGNQVPVPQDNAGLCDANASTCSEYIDPVSKFSPNLVVNPEHQVINRTFEGWGANCNERWGGNVLSDDNQQALRLEPYKMYSAVVTYKTATTSTVRFDFPEAVEQLKSDNNFGVETTSLETGDGNPLIFNSRNNKVMLITGDDVDKTKVKIISIKELVVDYQLRKNLEEDCNGQVKYNNGCILFNARTINGAAGLADLSKNWDAYATEDGKAPTLCSSTGSCTANKLIKVRPNRVCAKWLDCISYIQDLTTKEKSCYAFAECDRLDDKGECANFINPDATPLVINPKTNQNSTGYSLTNKYSIMHMTLVGQDLTVHEDFEDGNIIAFCSNVNFSGNCIINSPDAAQNNSATNYPAHGKGYVKIETPQDIVSNLSVKTTVNDEFYINYLVSTKDADGTNGLITITDDSNPPLNIKIIAQADTGWERKVSRVKLGAGQKKINISLSADPPGGKPVYFDDINIDPVLKTSNNTYAPPECRLYPTDDSLTCENINKKNIISDGLEGYCLEHDPANKDVCLIWYPMDDIPVPTRSKLGYNGNFPLNYCTSVSGNFDLLEKRVGYHGKYWSEDNIRVYYTSGGYKILGDVPDTGSNAYGCYNFNGSSSSNSYPVASYVKVCDGNSCGGPEYRCPADYNYLISSEECRGGSCTDHYHIMCVPKPANLRFTETAYHDESANGGDWAKCQNVGYTVGYSKFNGFDGYEESQTPKLLIYDYDQPPDTASDLKLIPGLTTGNGQYYHFNCNSLIQTINNAGENSAWVSRVAQGSTFPLGSSSPLFKQPYIQAMDKAPFGAATLPETYINVGDEVVTLRDLENTDIPYAGRPYGCQNGIGKNCELIGVCSGDNTTYCLATTNLETVTCKNKGTCLPLWNAAAVASLDQYAYKDVFKNIFLKTTTAFRLNSFNNRYYEAAEDLKFSFTPAFCNNNTRPAWNPSNLGLSYCAIQPIVRNVKLYFNDYKVPLASNVYDIKQKGIYRLEFNTIVDSEQQPLNKIEIEWGDGSTQTVTNQDNRAVATAPHVFYHYYGQTGQKNIKITARDNWGFYKTFPPEN